MPTSNPFAALATLKDTKSSVAVKTNAAPAKQAKKEKKEKVVEAPKKAEATKKGAKPHLGGGKKAATSDKQAGALSLTDAIAQAKKADAAAAAKKEKDEAKKASKKAETAEGEEAADAAEGDEAAAEKKEEEKKPEKEVKSIDDYFKEQQDKRFALASRQARAVESKKQPSGMQKLQATDDEIKIVKKAEKKVEKKPAAKGKGGKAAAPAAPVKTAPKEKKSEVKNLNEFANFGGGERRGYQGNRGGFNKGEKKHVDPKKIDVESAKAFPSL